MCEDHSKENGVPIFRSSLKYQGKSKNSMNSHGTRCTVVQFPLKVAFASTTHALQGAQINKGSNLIAHGYAGRVPKCLYYVMLSRVSSLDNVFLDEKFELEKILCNEYALQESNELEQKSISNGLKDEALEIFYINVRSFQTHPLHNSY